MFTLLNELHFWTFRSEIAIRDTDFGSFCYYEKRTQLDYEFLLGKKSYCEQRGIVWNPSNKRPTKLRDSIRELEECLETSNVIYSQWKEPDCLLLILGSGLLISLKINVLTGDLENIHFDRHLLPKLSSEHVSDVAVGGSEAIFVFNGGKVLAVHYAKSALKSNSKHWVTVDSRSGELVATSSNQSLRLRISSNSTSDKLAVWWEQDGYPWQQLSTGFPPIHIYHFSNLRPEPACCLRTEAQPVLVMFSQFKPSILHIVVQIVSPRGDVWLGWCQMDISSLRGDRGTTVQSHRTVPLQNRAVTVSLSPAEDKLLIVCSDSTLIVADYSYDCVVTNKTSFCGARVVAWHPDSCILVAGDEKAKIQFFDSSLSPIKAQLISDQHAPSLHLDIGAYFRRQPTLLSICWNRKPSTINSTVQIDAFLFLHFERGPIGVLKLLGGSRPGYSVDTVICHYLSGGTVDRAISLLSTLAWDSAGSVALASLQSIVNYLLARPLTPESHELLDKAIGCYFDSKRSISRVTCVEFNDSITDMRRKLFHQLLRYQVYEAALKLGVDLGHYDLLMDLHNQAKASGLNKVASSALEKAEQISEYSSSRSRSSVSSHSSYESSCSWCSRSSCSQCQENDHRSKRLKSSTKEEKKIYKGCEREKNIVDTGEAVGAVNAPLLEENSSQASSKTSLLPYLSDEVTINKRKECNSVDSITAPVMNAEDNSSTEDYERDSTDEKCNLINNLNENHEITRSEIDKRIDLINKGFENCVRIEMDNIDESDIVEGEGIKGINAFYGNRVANGVTIQQDDNSETSRMEDGIIRSNHNGQENCIVENQTNQSGGFSWSNNNCQLVAVSSVQLNTDIKPKDTGLDNSGKQEVHRSSLWGKDRVHVRNVVGDQWFGSLVRVSKNLKLPSTSSKCNIENNGSSDQKKGYGEWTDYQTCIAQGMYGRHPDFESHFCSNTEYRRTPGYSDPNNRALRIFPKDRPHYDAGRWSSDDPRLSKNLCDLQKESFIDEDFRNQRKNGQFNGFFHHNWMEPHSTGVVERTIMNSPPPVQERCSDQPAPYRNSNDHPYWTGNYKSHNLYERLNPPLESWNRNYSNNQYSDPNILKAKNINWTDSSTSFNRQPELPPARVGPNLWINPQGNNGSGIFWPKPYLGPRERPPPPPPPPPPRPKVKFSDNVTHISLPQMDDIQPVVEGNINTVGLPDTELPGFVIPRRQNTATQPLEPLHHSSSSSSNQDASGDTPEETSKVKVVHFGLV